MKTTIELPNSLFEEARRLAQRERRTMRALVEEGLRRVIADHKKRSGFRLRDATFQGNGFQPGFAGASWEKVREAIYEEHGG
jgi:hypothetical protein